MTKPLTLAGECTGSRDWWKARYVCAADTLVGSMPLIGDMLDFAYKASLRNARLMDAYLDRRALRGPRSLDSQH